MLYPDLNQFSDEFKKYLKEIAIVEQYKRGQVIFSPGSAEYKAWFIKKGIAKIFFYNQDGKQIVTCFLKEREILTCVESFFGNHHTNFYIEVLEDCVLYSMSSQQFQTCYPLFEESYKAVKDIIIGYKVKSDQRANLLILPAKERY